MKKFLSIIVMIAMLTSLFISPAMANEDIKIMINGKQEKAGVKDVFDYLFNELNKKCVEEFNTGNVYKNQNPTSTPNFPTGFEEINMTKIYDFEYKTRLKELWTH